MRTAQPVDDVFAVVDDVLAVVDDVLAVVDDVLAVASLSASLFRPLFHYGVLPCRTVKTARMARRSSCGESSLTTLIDYLRLAVPARACQKSGHWSRVSVEVGGPQF